MYSKTMLAGWGDMDFNAHMRNTAYLDKSADLRMMFFAEHGFPSQTFRTMGLGPVILSDEITYFKEIHLLQQVEVRLMVVGHSEDGSHFKLCNEFYRPDGKMAARVVSTGGWMDLSKRRLVVPPEVLLAAMKQLPRTPQFEIMPSKL